MGKLIWSQHSVEQNLKVLEGRIFGPRVPPSEAFKKEQDQHIWYIEGFRKSELWNKELWNKVNMTGKWATARVRPYEWLKERSLKGARDSALYSSCMPHTIYMSFLKIQNTNQLYDFEGVELEPFGHHLLMLGWEYWANVPLFFFFVCLFIFGPTQECSGITPSGLRGLFRVLGIGSKDWTHIQGKQPTCCMISSAPG